MRILVGTSGYAYKEWKGAFYPEDLAADDMLRYYGARLPAVEINNTFYRLPKVSVLEKWASQVPDSFVFVLKASQKITHKARLRADVAESALAYLWKTASVLGPRLGPFLFQLPPNLRKDVGRLREFLAGLPEGSRAAFEFRHASWFSDDVYDALRDAGVALCIAETEDDDEPAVVATAPYGYLRLRKETYDAGALARWAERVAAQTWNEAFVFFKHEEGASPVTALQFWDVATSTCDAAAHE